MAAGLSQPKQIHEDLGVATGALLGFLAQQAVALILQDVVDLLLGLLEDLVVDDLLLATQRELDDLHPLLGQVDDPLLGALELVLLGPAQHQVVAQERGPVVKALGALEGVSARRLVGAGRELLGGEYVLPEREVVQGLEVQELDEGVEVVERVVDGRAGDGDAVLGA